MADPIVKRMKIFELFYETQQNDNRIEQNRMTYKYNNRY